MNRIGTTLILAFTLLISSAGALCAQSTGQPLGEQPLGGGANGKLPKAAEGIGVDTKEGDYLERDLIFDNDKNIQIKLGDYFDGKRPVMLSFNYSNCPKLCSVQLQNMAETLKKVDFKIGKDFQFISISIDPNEQSTRARKSKERYMKFYNVKGSEDSWHFLTGDRDSIEYAAELCGFRYKYIPHQKLFSHPPVFILISPQGQIVRYIHGLDYDPVTIERALIETAKGKIGSPINRLSYGLGCFLFDETTGKYTMQVMGIMRLGGAATIVLLIGSLMPYWFFKRGRDDMEESDDSDSDTKDKDLDPTLDRGAAAPSTTSTL